MICEAKALKVKPEGNINQRKEKWQVVIYVVTQKQALAPWPNPTSLARVY